MKTTIALTFLIIILSTGCGISPSNPVLPAANTSPALLAPPAPLPEETIEDLRAEISELKAEIAALKSQIYGATINVVDINSASSTTLQTLPGIGPITACKIISTRLELRGFSTIDDLLKVPGIGSQKLNAIRPLVKIGSNPDLETLCESTSETPDPGPNPSNPPDNLVSQKININTATAPQLQILPGIGPSKSAAIVDYRTTHGHFSTVEHLIKVKGIGPKTLAKFITLITV